VIFTAFNVAKIRLPGFPIQLRVAIDVNRAAIVTDQAWDMEADGDITGRAARWGT
jgi:hypothetical protein